MSVFGIAMVKNEADVIGTVVTHMALQVDHVIVCDNLSSDSTHDILDSLSHILPVTVLVDSEVAYYQSRKMSWLAARAADMGASWVVPFDADEMWYAPETTIREFLTAQPYDVALVQAQLFDHVATGHDLDEPDPIVRIGWRRIRPLELPKIAVRPTRSVVIQQGNHDALYPAVRANGLTVRHFPYRSIKQFVQKAVTGAAAYSATDLPESWGAHWRQWGALYEALGEEALHEVFRKWYWVADPTNDPNLIHDPAPI